MRSDLNTFPIDQSSSLAKIAETLGLKPKILKDFHNLNALPHEWIKDDDQFPTWLNHIYIPDSVINLTQIKKERESLDFISLKQSDIDVSNYTIMTRNDLQVSGNSMIDSETVIIWEYFKQKKDGFFYGDLRQIAHQVKYIKSIYRQFAEYMQKFNRPIDHLNFELNTAGSIKSIANQDEIWSEWMILKQSMQNEVGNTLEEKNIIEGGDKDFRDTLPLIKNNILYNLFFNDVYQDYHKTGTFVEEEKKQYNSQAFSNEKVNITVKRKAEKQGNLAKIKFLCEGNSEQNRHLREIYNSKLKEFLKEDFNYSLLWTIEYHFDIEKGKMLFCHSKVKEQASRNYIYSTEHKITLT